MEQTKKDIFVIAEIANAHEGSVRKAERLIHSAAAAGADAVKFQKFTADELLVKNHSRYAHFKNLEMNDADWKRLRRAAKEKGLLFFCDVFGNRSLEFVRQLNVDGIKIHSSDLANDILLANLKGWDKFLFLSCGGATEFEIYKALEIVRPLEKDGKLFLMHGFQNFPTSLEETNLFRIGYLKDTFGLPVGFMDHIDPEDDMAFTLSLLAIAAGADVIEKHITLDRSLKGIDYYSSFNPDEMKCLLDLIRRTEKVFGSKFVLFGAQEKNYRKKMKKHLVVSRDIKAGEFLDESVLTYKRAEADSFSLNSDSVVGKAVKQSITAETPLRFSDLCIKAGILIIARMNSRRLPGKALIPIMNKPALAYLIERAKLCKSVDAVILCTTVNPRDDVLVDLAKSENIAYYRGDELDVLKRMLGAGRQEKLDIVVRVTGDDIFLSPRHLDQAVHHLMRTNCDYCHNKSLPGGTECEVFTVRALKIISDFAEQPENTEYLTYFIDNAIFQKTELPVAPEFQRGVDLTLDIPEDLEKITFLLENIYNPEIPFTQEDLIRFIDKHPGKFKKREAASCTQAKEEINCRLNFKKASFE